MVSGKAKIVDGRMLVCPRCLEKQAARKSSKRTPAIAGFLLSVAIVGAGFLMPRYFMLLGTLGCALTALVAMISPALSSRERVLGLGGALALGLVCAGGMYAFGMGESARGDMERIREEAEAVRKLLAADDILEAQRRAAPLLSPPPSETLRKPSAEAQAALQSLEKSFEEWFAKDYGPTSPLERTGLLQLFRGFGQKNEAGQPRFAGLKILENKLRLQVRTDSDAPEGTKANPALEAEWSRLGKLYAGYLLDFYSDLPSAEVRWVRVQAASEPEVLYVFTLNRQDLRKVAEPAARGEKGPPSGPPPNPWAKTSLP
ncbi:MAG: hypothetical protein HY291_09575 [Planctomycetes bacterium]|nr:hypothetical protein [Planctomycetota bacterium]